MINLTREFSLFFFNLHEFCNNYEKKILKAAEKGDVPKEEKLMKTKKISKKKPNCYMKFYKKTVNELKKKDTYKNYDGRMLSKVVGEKWKNLS